MGEVIDKQAGARQTNDERQEPDIQLDLYANRQIDNQTTGEYSQTDCNKTHKIALKTFLNICAKL